MLVAPQHAEFSLAPFSRNTQQGFVAALFNDVVFAEEGPYTFTLTVNDSLAYQTTLSVAATEPVVA